MKKFDEEEFDTALICVEEGKEIKGLYTIGRIERDSLPAGFYKYDIRESDNGDNAFCTVEPFVMVNHTGTIITREEIPMLIEDKTGGYSEVEYFEEGDEFSHNDWRKQYIKD